MRKGLWSGQLGQSPQISRDPQHTWVHYRVWEVLPLTAYSWSPQNPVFTEPLWASRIRPTLEDVALGCRWALHHISVCSGKIEILLRFSVGYVSEGSAHTAPESLSPLWVPLSVSLLASGIPWGKGRLQPSQPQVFCKRRFMPQKRKCLAPSPASAVRVEGPALRWCEYPPGVKHMPSASGHLNPVFKVVLVHGRHQMVGPRHGNLSNYPPGSAWVKTRQHRAK